MRGGKVAGSKSPRETAQIARNGTCDESEQRAYFHRLASPRVLCIIPRLKDLCFTHFLTNWCSGLFFRKRHGYCYDLSRCTLTWRKLN